MKSEISFSGIGAKNIAKTQPLPPCWDRKKKRKILNLTERGKVGRHSTRFNNLGFYGITLVLGFTNFVEMSNCFKSEVIVITRDRDH